VSASSDGTIRVWNARDSSAEVALRGHDGIAYACVLTRDQRFALSAGTDHRLKVWELRDNAEVGVLPLPGDGECLALHPQRPMVACGERGGSLLLVDLVGFEDRRQEKEE
jgi:WD40 repeat protein